MTLSSPRVRFRGVRAALAGFVALLAVTPAAFCQPVDYYWNPPGAAAGTWANGTTLWGTTNVVAAPDYAWTSSGNERANFGATTTTAVTVTLSTPVSAYGVNFVDYYSQFLFVSTNAVGPGAFTISGTGTLTLAGPGGVIDTGGVISNTTSGPTISSIVGGSVGLTKNGAGTLTLSGADTYSGTTQVNAGALAIGSATALGNSSGVSVTNGGALQLGAFTINLPLTLNGGGSTTSASGVATGGALRGTATGAWTGLITLASAARINSDSGTLTIGTAGNPAITATSPNTTLTVGGAATVTIPGIIGANVGQLVKDGAGTLNLTGANLYTGGTAISGSKVVGTAQTTGGNSPFGAGPVALNFASLTLNGVASTNTTTTVGSLTVGAANVNGTGASNLIVSNNTSAFTTTLAAGALIRGGTGSVLVITPGAGATGALGSGPNVTFTGGNSNTNGILPPWVIATASTTTLTADFVSYGSAVTTATAAGAYFAGDLTTSSGSSVVNQSASPTITAPVAAYALKTNVPIALGGNALALGNGSGQTGLILNTGASITGGAINFGNTEGMVYVQGTATLGGAGDTITSNGLTATALGAAIVTIGGNIADGSVPAKLTITAITANTSITLSGTNTYSGGTILSVNSGTGNIFIGTDNAFGTGKVTNILAPGTSSPQLQAQNGTRTLANAFDLNGGLSFTGSTNGFVLTGPINVIQSQAGPVYSATGSAPNAPTGTRTLNNTMTGAATLTLGSVGSPSTITLGNPVSNGGDGVGKSLLFTSSTGTTTIINDQIVDPAVGGGVASGNVTYNGTQGLVQITNGTSTYSGGTRISAGTTKIQFATSSVVNGAGAILSGPFGTGPIMFDNGSNAWFEPSGGSQTIANPIQLGTGFTVATDTAGANLTLSGPITFSINNGRFISNGTLSATNAPTQNGQTLTVGLAASPSTITLGNGSGQTTTFSPVTGPIVVNDVIQDPSGIIGVANRFAVRITGNANENGPITFTAPNTYAGPTSVLRGQLLVNNTSGSGTGTGNVTVTGATTSGFFGILSGNGSIAGGVTVSAGVTGGANAEIAPGPLAGTFSAGPNTALVIPQSVGTLSLGSGLVLAGTYLADVETGPNQNDLVAVTGNLNLAGATLTLPASNTYDGVSTYTLMTYTGTLTSTFATVNNLPANYLVSYSTLDQVNLVPVVPEPGTFALCGLAAIGLARCIRRGRKPLTPAL